RQALGRHVGDARDRQGARWPEPRRYLLRREQRRERARVGHAPLLEQAPQRRPLLLALLADDEDEVARAGERDVEEARELGLLAGATTLPHALDGGRHV